MTVALLAKWGDQPPGTLYNSDNLTEAAMIAAKVATATLGGAVAWAPNTGSLPPPSKSPIILAQSAIPMILPSSGTMGANGALTGLTALPYSVFPQPCYMYFPAGKVYAGSLAGMYYASITSATAATVYNNQYSSGVPAIPASPTPVVDAGPGAYTQTTATDISLFSITVPGGLMGPNGALRISRQLEVTNNVNLKGSNLSLGGTVVHQLTGVLTSVAGYSFFESVRNRGTQNSQVSSRVNSLDGASFTSSTFTSTAIDTSVDKVLAGAGNLAVATDNIILQAFTVEVLPG